METGPSQTEKAHGPSDIVLAREYTLRELPGLWRRYLALTGEEYGLKVSRGHVVGELRPDGRGVVRKPIGWALLGVQGPGAVRLWTGPVQVRPGLFRMASGDQPPEPVDVFLSATVQVTDPARFYMTSTHAGREYHCSDLANEMASSLEQPMQKQLLWYSAETLSLDEGGAVSKRLAGELAPTLGDFLASRGVSLISLDILSIIPSEAEDQLVKEVEELRGKVVQDQANLDAVVDKVAAPLRGQGLVAPEEIDRLKAACKESPEQGQELLGRLIERFTQWRDEQLQSRVAQLAIKGKAPDKGQAPIKKGKGWLPIVIYAVLAVAIGAGSALLYWFRFSKLGSLDLNPSHIAAGAGLVALLGVGLLLIIQVVADRLLHFVISKIKEAVSRRRASKAGQPVQQPQTVPAEASMSQPQEKPARGTATPGGAEAWLTRESLKTDEIIRRQVARELSQAANNINEARYEAIRQKLNGLAQSARSLVEGIDAFRSKVDGAAYYGSIVLSDRRQARGRASELISFEEDLWRQAQVFQLASEKVAGLLPDKPAEAEAEVKAMVGSLRRLESHFSRREAVLDGLVAPGLKPAGEGA